MASLHAQVDLLQEELATSTSDTNHYHQEVMVIERDRDDLVVRLNQAEATMRDNDELAS